MLTGFEQRVLIEVRKIPKGNLATYAMLAKRVGSPKSARAVGNALHKNPNAPKVPCHRVIKSDGNLGGYAGGHKRKIDLLKEEGIKFKNGKIINWRKFLIN